MRGLTIAGLFVALLSWGCDGQEAPGRASSEPASSGPASSGPASSEPVAFEVPPDPSAPVRVVEQVGAPLRRGAGYADVRVRVQSLATRDIERLDFDVYVLDEDGALLDELHGFASRDPELLPAGASRVVELTVRLAGAYRGTSLDHLAFSPDTAQFCDGSTWMADLGRTIPGMRPGHCRGAGDGAERPAPPGSLAIEPGELIGPGYSVVVPVGYGEDTGHPLYPRGVRGLRKSGAYDRFISIFPAQPTVNAPGAWENLEPTELDLERCRELLRIQGDVTLAMEETGSPDVRMCVARQEDQTVRIIVTTHIDYRMLCWTGGDADVAQACDAVARSWRHRG